MALQCLSFLLGILLFTSTVHAAEIDTVRGKKIGLAVGPHEKLKKNEYYYVLDDSDKKRAIIFVTDVFKELAWAKLIKGQVKEGWIIAFRGGNDPESAPVSGEVATPEPEDEDEGGGAYDIDNLVDNPEGQQPKPKDGMPRLAWTPTKRAPDKQPVVYTSHLPKWNLSIDLARAAVLDFMPHIEYRVGRNWGVGVLLHYYSHDYEDIIDYDYIGGGLSVRYQFGADLYDSGFYIGVDVQHLEEKVSIKVPIINQEASAKFDGLLTELRMGYRWRFEEDYNFALGVIVYDSSLERTEAEEPSITKGDYSGGSATVEMSIGGTF